MESLPARLQGFIDGLCAASRITFPYGGLQLMAAPFGERPEPLPPSDPSEPQQRLLEFFACAFGDTARSRPNDAEPVVESFFSLIRETFPGCSLHTRITEDRGWFDALEIWVTSPGQNAYIYLDWSIS